MLPLSALLIIITIIIQMNSIDNAAIPSLLHWDQNIVLSGSTPDGCIFNYKPYKIGDKWRPSLDSMAMFKCVECECKEKDNSNTEGGYVFCKNLRSSCEKLNCKKTKIVDGECCPQCVIDTIKTSLRTLPKKVPYYELYLTLLHSPDNNISTIVATSILYKNKLYITINEENLAIRKIQLTDSLKQSIYFETSSLNRIETKDGDSLNIIIELKNKKLLLNLRDDKLYLNIETGGQITISGLFKRYEATFPYLYYSLIFNISSINSAPLLATFSFNKNQNKIMLKQDSLAISQNLKMVYTTENIRALEGVSIFPIVSRNNPHYVELRYFYENDIQRIFDNPTWLSVTMKSNFRFEGQIQTRPLFRSWYTELRTTFNTDNIFLANSNTKKKGWVEARLIDSHTIEIEVYLEYSQLSITVIDVQFYVNEDVSILDLSDRDFNGRISYTWTGVSWRDIDMLIKSQIRVVAYAIGEEEAKLGGLLLPKFYFDDMETDSQIDGSHELSTEFYNVEPNLDSSAGIMFYVPLIEKFRDKEIVDMLVIENGDSVVAKIDYKTDENALENLFEGKFNGSRVNHSSALETIESEISNFELVIRYRDSTGEVKGVNGGKIKLKVDEAIQENSIVSIVLPRQYQNKTLNESCFFNEITYSFGDQWNFSSESSNLDDQHNKVFNLKCKCSEFGHVHCQYSCNFNSRNCQARQLACSSNNDINVVNNSAIYGCLDNWKYRTVNETWYRQTNNDEVCICGKSTSESKLGQVECVKISEDCKWRIGDE